MIALLHNYLVVGAILFVIGAIGFVTRRNLILMVLSAEMMLQGVSLTFVAYGRFHQDDSGQSMVVFILTVAACEAALALALVMGLYQRQKTLDVEVWRQLGEPSTVPVLEDDAALPPENNGHPGHAQRVAEAEAIHG